VRRIILGVRSTIHEGIKWNAPTFRTENGDFATFNLRARDGVQLILHLGAKVRSDQKAFRLADPRGLLKWLGKDRALVTLGAGQDIPRGAPPSRRSCARGSGTSDARSRPARVSGGRGGVGRGGANDQRSGVLHRDRSPVRERPRRARVPAAADRGHPARGMAGAATANPERRPHRAPRRVLAGRRAEPVVRRHGRGLGARALLARRGDPAGMDPRRRAAQGADHALRRARRRKPAPGRVVRALPRGRRHEAVRPVGDPPREPRRSCSITRRPATPACSRR
jgi:hypothetical protein